MRIQTIFSELLGLQAVVLRGVDLDTEEHRLVAEVSLRGRRHRCPRCGHCSKAAYDSHERRWRHLPLGRYRVWLRMSVSRLVCPTHGVIVEAVPFAEHDQAFTTAFEDLAAWLTREMSKTAVTRFLRVSWSAIGAMITRSVARHRGPDQLDGLFVIGVDEKSYRRGHKYLTIVVDHLRGLPTWIREGRSQATLSAFFDALGPDRSWFILVVSMDMCAAYIAAVREAVPTAHIAFDPFHVVRLANEALQTVRRTDARELKGTPAAKVLKGERWTLLRASENLDDAQRVRLADVARLNQRVYRAYMLKEELRALYRCPDVETARKHLDDWLAWASRSKLAPFVRLARTLRRYKDGVLAAIHFHISNARLESLNAKIDLVQRRAFGFHSAEALIAMIWLCCTPIAIPLPTDP
jgi:transposase